MAETAEGADGRGGAGSRDRVVVAGGGFAGIYAALYLAQEDPGARRPEVLLVSEDNHFTFTPLLHDVLGGSLDGQHVAAAYRVMARRHDFGFLQARVEGLDPDEGRLETTAGPVAFDHLILALGASPHAPGAEAHERLHVTPFHRISHAVTLHHRVMELAELASREADPGRRRRLLTFVVGGGGPAGVEAAGEIHHLLRHVLPEYYDGLDEARVVLVHGGARILPGWDPELVEEGQETLRRSGIDLRLDTRLEGASEESVELSSDEGKAERLPASTLVWAIGTRPRSGVLEDSGLPLGPDGHVEVDRHLRARGRERIWAAGDLTALENPRTGESYPAVAPIALSQGIRAAANVLSERGGWPQEPYRGHHAGKIVTLGGRKALVDILGLTLHGRPAWMVNRAAYLLKLVGARNKAHAAATLLLNRIFERNLLTDA